MKGVEKGSKYIVLSCWNSRVSILVLTLFLFSSGGIWAQVPSYVPKDSLVGWWPFNGNANKKVGTGNYGSNFILITTIYERNV